MSLNIELVHRSTSGFCRLLIWLCIFVAMSSHTQAWQVEAIDGAANAVETKEEDPLEGLVGLERLKKAVEYDAYTRWAMLGTISPRGVSDEDRAEMVKIFAEQLDHDYPDLRGRAAEMLALFGSDAAPAIPKLMEHIDDAEKNTMGVMTWVPVSQALAATGAEHVLQPLIEELPKTMEPELVEKEGVQRIQFGNGIRTQGLLAAISALGKDAKSAAPVIIDILRHGPDNRRWGAMFTLSKLGDAALPAIPDYVWNLDHPDFNRKVMACRALAELGPKSKVAVPKLLKLVEKPNILSTRTHAAMCLGAIGPIEGVDLIQIFTDMIEETNAFSQERGLIALGRLGRHAENARSFVEDLLTEGDFSQRPEAARTMWQLTGDPKPTLEILEALIDDPTYDYRCHAVLKEMGPDAAPLSGLLAGKLNSDDQSIRMELIEIIESMGKTAEHADAIRAALDGAAPDTALLIDKVLARIPAGDN